MESSNQDNAQRLIRRRLRNRLTCHWMLFFGVALCLTVVLEFLFGGPQRPTPEVVLVAIQRHAVVFAALLALFPISLRDCLRCIDKTLFPQLRPDSRLPSAAHAQDVDRQTPALDAEPTNTEPGPVGGTRKETRQPAAASV